ncbi:MAG: LLM class flavin-dependent oxidoreductase [Acidimicrobiia bacterium]|nr:LLM class flavin-dependent oxidoreductase [Acidimicrobiia bacterium]
MTSRSNRPLAVGVQLPEVEREVGWEELRAMAVLAEEVGFDSVWVGDHLLYRPAEGPPVGPWEAWSLLAAIAAVTHRVQIGPLVAATSFHNPAMLAKKAATVDEISGGRLIVGLGAGWNRAEYDAFGFPFDRRASRFEEAFTIIRGLLRQGRVDFAGAFYQATDCELVPRPRPGGPPLMVGSKGDRVLRITMPHVDMWNGWFQWFGNTVEGLGGLMAKVDAACESVGRDPAEVERTVAVLVSPLASEGRPFPKEQGEMAPPVTGSAQQIADTLAGYAEAGVSHLQLVLDPITLPAIERCGEVLAALG